MNTDIMQPLHEAVRYIQSRVKDTAGIGVILGSGLGKFSETLEVLYSIPYTDIPYFPESTVLGHGGELLLCAVEGKKVWVMRGRFHYYEGYTPAQVVFPVRVMKLLGVHTLLLSNAAGSVNPDYGVGDLVIIKDHISFFAPNPLLGKNVEALGTRFPDMSEPYSKNIIARAEAIAASLDIPVHKGVYLGVTGPTFETRAEYRLIKLVGGDVVGMSTVQETIAAVHAGMKVFCMSVVTDLGIREEENAITHQEVLEAANAAEPKLTALYKALILELA